MTAVAAPTTTNTTSSNQQPVPDVQRQTSTGSSHHSDHTLCNEFSSNMYITKQQPQTKKIIASGSGNSSPARRRSGEEDTATFPHVIAAATANASAPKIEKRPTLMQRFLGTANGNNSNNNGGDRCTASPAPVGASTTRKHVTPPASVRSSTSGNGGANTPHQRRGSEASTTFEQKYGTCSRECIGRGATAIVRVAYKQHSDGPQMYAIKRFRKQKPNELERDYIKKLTSEYCISSSVNQKNIVSTLDLIQDPQKNWCQVMEYCPGGDLYTIIRDGQMGLSENECCFKQMCQGVAHLHSLGVCHRDVKPENLLLDAHNTVKITDFGVADVFRVAWETRIHKSRGLCGSEPYIAPEMFAGKSYDGRKADVWSAAVVYYTMVYNGIPWRKAREEDTNYQRFLEAIRSGRDYEGFRRIDPRTRKLIQRMLCPDPQERPTMEEVLRSEVLQRICVCNDEGQVAGGGYHSHYTEEYEGRRNSRKMRAQAAQEHQQNKHHLFHH